MLENRAVEWWRWWPGAASCLPDWLTYLQVESLKQQGNAALQAGNVDSALDLYTQALKLSGGDNAVLYSNRSAAYCKAGRHEEALEDAEKVVTLRPDWVKVR